VDELAAGKEANPVEPGSRAVAGQVAQRKEIQVGIEPQLTITPLVPTM
jgi:hypothetical protein